MSKALPLVAAYNCDFAQALGPIPGVIDGLIFRGH